MPIQTIDSSYNQHASIRRRMLVLTQYCKLGFCTYLAHFVCGLDTVLASLLEYDLFQGQSVLVVCLFIYDIV